MHSRQTGRYRARRKARAVEEEQQHHHRENRGARDLRTLTPRRR
jgi:hypothetical protein